MRADLLALSPDDLTAFSNRGLTRRAEQEAANPALVCTIAETAEGHVRFQWGDGVTCDLPAGARLTDARCTCSSTTLCRHILRSVFAYQRQHQAAAGAVAEPAAAPTAGAPDPVAAPVPAAPGGGLWNPGTIADAALTPYFAPAEFARLGREFASGHVVQLWTGTKPRAYLHTLGCTVNFLVPHDIRYAACDCAANAPCGHAVLAVWAFRLLPTGQANGLISTAPIAPEVPAGLLDDIETEIRRLAETSLARAPALQVDLWRRLATRARDAALVWPAEVLGEIAEMHTAYLAQDARFDPREFLSLVAELLQRLDAIRRNRTPVPPLFVRGSASNRETEFGSARLIGLGCGVRLYRGGTELTSYLQDSDSGGVVVVSRRFPDPPKDKEPPRPFCALAGSLALKGTSLGALGRGQLLIKGGRRTPSGQFLPGRAPVSISPQAYLWETLRAPLRVAGFDELRDQLKSAPPAALAPRQAGTRLAVCPVASASEVEFLVSSQQIVGRLQDTSGQEAWLVHPFRNRASGGSERLLAALRERPGDVRFVCGEARVAGADLVLSPVSVVFETSGTRTCIQPWVDEAEKTTAPARLPVGSASAETTDPLHDYLEELLDLEAEAWLTGLGATASAWPRLHTLGISLGLTKLADFSAPLTPARLLELTVLADYAHREFNRLDTPPSAEVPRDALAP
ncbi:MAG TPA: hypothetical protein VG734_06870 [Lacunisphaera sp.]|nr:hypothetical protein [Lacunisphaera sp.]